MNGALLTNKRNKDRLLRCRYARDTIIGANENSRLLYAVYCRLLYYSSDERQNTGTKFIYA